MMRCARVMHIRLKGGFESYKAIEYKEFAEVVAGGGIEPRRHEVPNGKRFNSDSKARSEPTDVNRRCSSDGRRGGPPDWCGSRRSIQGTALGVCHFGSGWTNSSLTIRVSLKKTVLSSGFSETFLYRNHNLNRRAKLLKPVKGS